MEEWLAKFVSKDVSRPTGQLLMTLNEAIAEGFSYKRRSSRGTQMPGETLESQQGTCRDFALLMMEAARSLGLAARFVTGYVYVPDRDGPARLGRRFDSCMVPDLCPWLRLVRIRSYRRDHRGNRHLIRVGVAGHPSRQSRSPGVTGAMPTMNSEWKSR